jgi:hypothetical protein
MIAFFATYYSEVIFLYKTKMIKLFLDIYVNGGSWSKRLILWFEEQCNKKSSYEFKAVFGVSTILFSFDFLINS